MAGDEVLDRLGDLVLDDVGERAGRRREGHVDDRVVLRVDGDAVDETEVDDCRWTPCFDCGVCPQMDTDIQIGPTGKTLLPLTVLGEGAKKLAAADHAH